MSDMEAEVPPAEPTDEPKEVAKETTLEVAPPPPGSVKQRLTLDVPRNTTSTDIGQLLAQVVKFDRTHAGEVSWSTDSLNIGGAIGTRIIGEARW